MGMLKHVLSLLWEVFIKRVLKRSNIFYKLAVMSITFAAASLIPTLYDLIFGWVTSTNNECSYTVAGIFIGLTLIFAYLAYKTSKVPSDDLINVTKISPPVIIGSSEVSSFCGSVLNINNIDVVVTSENTDFELGSINGTSVSGRMRRLTADYNNDGTIHKDNLKISTDDWKTNHGGCGPYQLGITIKSLPFNAARNGIKLIVHAIALQKNSSGKNLIDEQAVNNIIQNTVNYCKTEGFSSIFIPVFGLGSGNISRDEAIKTTLEPLLNILKQESSHFKVYIGTYRLIDEIMVTKSLFQTGYLR